MLSFNEMRGEAEGYRQPPAEGREPGAPRHGATESIVGLCLLANNNLHGRLVNPQFRAIIAAPL